MLDITSSKKKKIISISRYYGKRISLLTKIQALILILIIIETIFFISIISIYLFLLEFAIYIIFDYIKNSLDFKADDLCFDIYNEVLNEYLRRIRDICKNKLDPEDFKNILNHIEDIEKLGVNEYEEV